MRDIILSKEDFELFNQDDQFGFFYNEDGYPRDDAYATFKSDIEKLYQLFDTIIVDEQDNVYGLKDAKKELIMEFATEAYLIAREVKEFKD